MSLLVRTPSPHPTESLIGYALRVSEENGYDTPWHILSLSGMVLGQMLTAGFAVEKLASILGVGADTLAHIAYKELTGTARHFKILKHNLGQCLIESPLRLRYPAFCPSCVVEKGYIDAFWDLSAAVACPQHGTYALSTCPSCNSAIRWFRPGLLKCKCGAAFDEADASPATNALQALMAIFNSKLHGFPLAEMENRCYFPLQQLDQIQLGPLIQITRVLGRWNLTSHSLDVHDEKRILLAAIEPLQDWPVGFHGMLRRLGERALKNGVEGAGLRKQFNSFFESMFKGVEIAPYAGFIRQEFIAFGKFHWGQAVVDNKLHRNIDDLLPNNARFISKSEFAKRYGVWKPTMDRLIQTGVIATKRIKTSKKIRTLVDIDQSHIPGSSDGTMSVREAARCSGLPVSVLTWARNVGLYVTKVRLGYERTWHKEDVDEFIKRGMSLAPAEACGDNGMTVGKALQIHLREKGARPDILCAIFDGRLSVIGRNGDDFSGLILDSAEVDRFVQSKRLTALGDTFSAFDAAKETGLDPTTVEAAVKKGMLEVAIVGRCRRITGCSITSFCSEYLPLARLSAELGTLTRHLLKCCRENGILVINLVRSNVGILQPVLPRKDEVRLRAAWAAHLAQHAVLPIPRNQGEAFQVELLRKYLDELTRTGAELPRKSEKLNRRDIAKACGFDRTVFYSYPVLITMLDAHDAAERQRNTSIRTAPIVALQDYLNRLRGDKLKLPLGSRGTPNLLAISKAIGCNRDFFYHMTDARRMLNDFIEASTLAD